MKRIFYGWVIVFACALMLFCSIGMVSNNFSIFMPFIREEYGITHAQTSSLVTLRCFMSFAAMWVLGIYYDKLGTRLGIAIAVCFAASGYLIFSFAHNYMMFCVGALVMGICNAFASMVPAGILMNKWFIRNKATAIGICGAGSGVAMMIMPSITTKLYETFGLSQAFRIECFGMYGLAVIIFLLIRNNPEDMGLKPLGFDEMHETFKNAPSGLKETEKPMTKALWFSTICASLIMGALANPGYSHLSALFTSAEFEPMKVAMMISSIGFILTFSKLVLGRLVDRVGGLKGSYVFGGILFVGHIFCCLVYINNALVNFAIIICMGFGYAITTLSSTIWSNDIANKSNYSVVIRRLQTAQQAGALIFSTVPGALADIFHSYMPAYALFTVFMALSLIMISISYKLKASIERC
ncbi:MAG: MFS transporter [Firmicutes bacterium]|nr:MFS transporter [Bacillota bacterium]